MNIQRERRDERNGGLVQAFRVNPIASFYAVFQLKRDSANGYFPPLRTGAEMTGARTQCIKPCQSMSC